MSTKSFPTEVEISADQYKRLMTANDEITAINQMMQMFQAQVQQKITRSNAAAQEAWHQIAKEHGLDLNKQMWAPSTEKPNVIVLLQAQF